MADPQFSIVIPVYNSAGIIGETIDRTAAFCQQQGWDYEIILVNDGSRDASWQIVREKAQHDPRLVAINLLRNYGQHTALLCGFQVSRGAAVITMDDDLQNPPEEIVHLVAKAEEGHDVVFGRFYRKQHAGYRRAGSRLIRLVNRYIFGQPRDLVLSNFRLLRRPVVDRICAYRTHYPYITGLSLMFAANPANVLVEHRERPVGKSNYSFFRIAELVMRILFNYSAFPLRLVSLIGIAIAGLAFAIGAYYLIRGILGDVRVAGWTTLVVLLAFFNGITILILSMLGEYVVRLLNQTSASDPYHIKETVNLRD